MSQIPALWNNVLGKVDFKKNRTEFSCSPQTYGLIFVFLVPVVFPKGMSLSFFFFFLISSPLSNEFGCSQRNNISRACVQEPVGKHSSWQVFQGQKSKTLDVSLRVIRTSSGLETLPLEKLTFTFLSVAL